MERSVLEVYLSNRKHPALYDYHIDQAGEIRRMNPPPPRADTSTVHVVLEAGFYAANKNQLAALAHLTANHRRYAEFFR